jgi:uncharacterized protein
MSKKAGQSSEPARATTGGPNAVIGSVGMIAANLLRAQLSDRELDELEEFLQSRCLPKGGMNLSMLDGYLTAIVSIPEFIPPSEWLPRVWRGEGDGGADQERQPDDGVTFESSEEAKRLAGLVLRRMNEIIRDFEQETLQPIFLKRCAEDGVTQSVFADAWCVGYLRGMTVHGDAWEPLVTRGGDDSVYLTPIFALALSLLASDTDDDETPNALLNDQKRAELTELVPQAAYEIHQYWRERQHLPPATIRRTPQPGRNAACPCGSGQKYKKCCGRS